MRTIKLTENKQKALVSGRKAHTLLARVVKMVEQDKYCIDIIQQNLAVIGLLKSANQLLMAGHLNSCVKDSMKTKSQQAQQKMINEILRVTKLSNK